MGTLEIIVGMSLLIFLQHINILHRNKCVNIVRNVVDYRKGFLYLYRFFHHSNIGLLYQIKILAHHTLQPVYSPNVYLRVFKKQAKIL